MEDTLRLMTVVAVGAITVLTSVAAADVAPAIGQFPMPTDPVPVDEGWFVMPMVPGLISGRSTVGWSFTPTTEIEITSLGFYDSGIPGLCLTHDLALWDADEQLLAAATITPGISLTYWIDPPLVICTDGPCEPDYDPDAPSEAWEQQYPLVGDYRYAQIAPIRLEPGRTYILSGTLPPNDTIPAAIGIGVRADAYPAFGVDLTTPPVSSDITILDHREVYEPYPATTDLIFPDEPFAYDGHGLAVNFLYRPVPEPAAGLLLVIAASIRLRRRAR